MVRCSLGVALEQARANLIGGVGLAAALVPRDEYATGDDARRAGQADPLPDAAHADHTMLRW